MTTKLLSLAAMSSGPDNPLEILDSLPLDPSTWTDGQTFLAGIGLGFVLGASGFILRLVRQTAKQNPEI